MEQQKENNKQSKAQQVVDAFVKKSSQKTDPLGSYTGKPLDANSVPTQDQDDL